MRGFPGRLLPFFWHLGQLRLCCGPKLLGHGLGATMYCRGSVLLRRRVGTMRRMAVVLPGAPCILFPLDAQHCTDHRGASCRWSVVSLVSFFSCVALRQARKRVHGVPLRCRIMTLHYRIAPCCYIAPVALDLLCSGARQGTDYRDVVALSHCALLLHRACYVRFVVQSLRNRFAMIGFFFKAKLAIW